ncbi:unnamed protein product [Mycena citricolor]|uniref:Velvet domain-containing protein n=1 Tax=Mycena citricolor TaxID=2018698 RepID=A0AAD2H0J1_9AGAR|nr:unnamed protein product [Mycena citricolor]
MMRCAQSIHGQSDEYKKPQPAVWRCPLLLFLALVSAMSWSPSYYSSLRGVFGEPPPPPPLEIHQPRPVLPTSQIVSMLKHHPPPNTKDVEIVVPADDECSRCPGPLHSIRPEIHEIQTAKVGRKCGGRISVAVDRRPLDPPPVVQLRFFAGDSTDAEITDYRRARAHCDVPSETPVTHFSLSPCSADRSTATASSASRSCSGICQSSIHAPASLQTNSASACVARALSEISVTNARVIQHEGAAMVVFPFTDLSSMETGRFLFRYRLFNMEDTAASYVGGHRVHRIVGECWGNPFQVYSTKDVPRLEASTELTKSLSEAGIPVSVRRAERIRKRKGIPPAQASHSPATLASDG